MASSSTAAPSSLPPIQTELSTELQQPKKNSFSGGSRGSLENSEFLANRPPPKHPSQRTSPTQERAMVSPSGGPASRPAGNSNRTSATSSNLWASTVAATKGPLPSVIFAIPFPEPGPTLRKTSKTPMFMLYSPPRANYIKPKLINGKKQKEGLIKKVERKWQEEVQEGSDIKAGKIENPSSWKKFKGTVLTAASKALGWLPDNNIQTVGRLPPGKKIGLITVVYPHEDDDLTSRPIDRQSHDVRQGLEDILRHTRRKAMLKTGLSGLLLPVTAAIDVFCIVPIFLFEINIVYFSLQINGARKIAMLTQANSKAKKHGVTKVGGRKKGRFMKLKSRCRRGRGRREQEEQENDSESEPPHPASPPLPNERIGEEIFNVQKSRPNVFGPVMANLYSLCSAANPVAFPSKPKGSLIPPYRPDLPLVLDLIVAFKDWVPADVALRHNLDPQFVAKDLRLSMKKATKDYMRTLKKVKPVS
ncbi:hypothetical protein PSTG_08026 [Puccinia striiformis f. sp. tritici PST-78]|uniref:Uncharacterized protein n=1 Tax=Puccinia striiformis f. sp. tritici PST-78 TaxID=1165861 RepID=A0A0L0VHF9_9BASI|nr:hypothetical protein PSTG_08026 [Puccinia striiformis f. sp. tritici PST-78]